MTQYHDKSRRARFALVLLIAYAAAMTFDSVNALAARRGIGGLVALLDIATWAGFLTFISLIHLKKLVLGVACTATGALIPTFARDPTTGAISARAPNISFSLRGAPQLWPDPDRNPNSIIYILQCGSSVH
jgi:hypothetical protein